MKNFNSTSFFKACSGVALVLFACSAVFFSVRPAQASPQNFNQFSKTNLPVGNGKYNLTYSIGSDGTKFYWHMVVFNTETGGYSAFSWDRDNQKWTKLFKENTSLPELP
ncbi:MAG: hypothetical protein IAF38_02625 [Bacteroidia bacterium]|nr:hypothetical protein [Bacteroidia bacterium]